MVTHAKQLREDILDLEHIPPLSMTASRLLEIAMDPDLEVTELADVIGQDPALCARILGLANSAFFAQPRPVVSVEEAIIRVLGLNMVRSLSLSIALAGSFDVGPCKGFDVADYWLSSLATAGLARDLAAALNDEGLDPDTVYLCGLLHRLGEILLVHLRPAEMQRVYEQLAQDDAADFHALTAHWVGVDDRVAGDWLSRRWHLPVAVALVLGQVGARPPAPEMAAGMNALPRLVALARHVVDGIESGSAEAPDLSGVGIEEERAATILQGLAARYEELRALAEMMA